MPGCSVFGCYSGYETTHKRGPEEKKYQLISFPKDARIRNLWVARIHRADWKPGPKACVCVKHFLPEDFSAVPGDLDKKGNERTKYRLKDNALPSLYLRGAESKEEPPRKARKIYASEADIKFNHSYVKEQPVQQVEQDVSVEPEEEPSSDANDMEDIIIATPQDIPGNELEILEDKSLTQANYQKIFDEKDAYIAKLEKENMIYKQKMQSVGKVLEPDQIQRLENPSSRMPWSDKTLQKSMQLYYTCGAKGYKFMRSKGHPLPDRSTIIRHVNLIESDFGTQHDMLRLMAMKIETLEPRDRKSAIVFDEMAIQPKREFDPSTGEFIGKPTLPAGPNIVHKRMQVGIDNDKILATHVFNVIVVGLVRFWKQLIGFHLTDESFCAKACAQWLREMLKALSDIGLEVMVVIHDMGPTNQAV